MEPAVWPALRRLVEQSPGFRQNEGLRRLVEQVELRKAGSATFPSRRGKLSLHVQVLAGASQPQVNAIVPGCAGILVWIRGTEALDGVRAVVQRLEASGPRGAAGVLVAGAEAAQPRGRRPAARRLPLAEHPARAAEPARPAPAPPPGRPLGRSEPCRPAPPCC